MIAAAVNRWRTFLRWLRKALVSVPGWMSVRTQ
jgi:hypothetical protein